MTTRSILIVAPGDAPHVPALTTGYETATWNGVGPTNHDWSGLAGRQVDIWLPATDADRAAAVAIAGKIFSAATRVRIVDTHDAEPGWSISSALANGMQPKAILAWGRDRIKVVSTPPTAEDPPTRSPAKRGAKVPRGTLDPGTAVTTSGVSAYVLWEQYGLTRAGNGKPHATADNVVRALSHLAEFSPDVLWYDEFRERTLTTWRSEDGRPREWADDDDALLLVHMQRALAWDALSEKSLQTGLRAFLQTRRRNPLTEYLDSLVWDGTDRLATFLADAYGTPQDAYHAAVGRCWLVSMVARAYRPGCQVDTIPVLEGAQGIRKSTSLEILGGEFYTSLPRGFGDVDFLQVMEGCWLGEIPDMASFRGRDLEHIKAFITIREDRYRRSYGRRAVTRKRQCVFAATDNGGNWNSDVTGARRFWPIACTLVNTDYLKEQRDQLFAEAKHRFLSREPWWDVPEERQRDLTEQRRTADAWEEVIAKYVANTPRREHGEEYWFAREKPLEELTVNDLLKNALDLPTGRWDRGSQMRVAACLQALGYTKIRRRDTAERYYCYVKYSR